MSAECPTASVATDPAPGADTIGDGRRWAALVLLCASQLMVILDGSIVAVALPVIGADLRVAGPALTWVVNAYLVPFAGLLLLAGRLGDLLGSRRVLLAGLGLFTTASVLCGLAPTLGVLAAARFLQGVGGALASAVVLGMIVQLFPGDRDRARALGAFGFVGAAGSSIGLVAGGVLTEALSWSWIFWVNLPLGLAALLGVRTLVPAPTGTGGRADALGAVLVTSGVSLTVYILLDTDVEPLRTVLLTAAAAALLAAFLARQASIDTPLLPLRLLTATSVGLGNLVQALMVAGLFGFQFLGVLYLQQLLAFTPLQAGLAFLPVPIVIAIVSLGLSARLISRTGLKPVLLGGLALIVVGLGLLTRLPSQDGYAAHLLPAGLLLAVGFGFAFPALAAVAVGTAPARDAGVASGLFNTTQQVGGALGLAVLTRLATSSSEDVGRTVITLDGYHAVFTAAAILVATALLLALRIPPTPPR
jgi:EmrB/QacA subfamily drug resistance transporter